MLCPSGTELARSFLPARDFDLSKQIYEVLEFEKLLDGNLAIFRIGSTGFILQRYYQKEWAENLMMQLMVDDLDGWWSHISALDLPGKFGVAPPHPRAMRPWGLRVAFVVDPCGALWHVAQWREGVVHYKQSMIAGSNFPTRSPMKFCAGRGEGTSQNLPLLKEYVHLVRIG